MVLNTHPQSKERVELYLYYLSGPSWPVLGLTLCYRCGSYLGNIGGRRVAGSKFCNLGPLTDAFTWRFVLRSCAMITRMYEYVREKLM